LLVELDKLMLKVAPLAVICATLATPAFAQQRAGSLSAGSPLIDYSGYMRIAAQTQSQRAKRLLSLTAFKAIARKGDVLVLDARSEQAFREGHIDGAVNLPLPDFNAASLREIIGANPDRQILIYCNNNFINDVRPIPTKVVQVALNIQTFINLRAYGYENVWELGEAVDMTNPAVGWVGTLSPGPFARLGR
jgi:phage shock protein E